MKNLILPLLVLLYAVGTLSSCAKKACGGWYGDRNLSQIEIEDPKHQRNMAVVDICQLNENCTSE